MQQAAASVTILGIRGIPEVREGDDLAALILDAAKEQGLLLQDGDVVVVTQKIVSKAEGRVVELSTIEPSPFALTIAQWQGKDPRIVEVVLRESRRIVRLDQRLMVMETHHGFVCANAGVDHSNIPGEDRVSLLPVDPDATARRLCAAFRDRAGAGTAVIISDSFGRPWREGITEVAIGIAGMEPLLSYIGRFDTEGHPLLTTAIAVADELCSAGGLVMEKLSKVPVAVVRGFPYPKGEGSARAIVRPAERDLFR